MTAAEIKKIIFEKYPIELDTDKTVDERKLVEQNGNEAASILARLDAALSGAGLGGLKIKSGYRSTKKQTELYKKSLANGGQPSTAKPKTSAHEWGSAIDCGSSKGNFDDFIKFSMKWFNENGIKFDQLIDESSSASNKCGWLHIGLTKLGKKEGNRNLYWVMWGPTRKAFNSVNDYINFRNKNTNSSGSGPTVTNSTELTISTTNSYSSNNTGSVKKMSLEEITAANQNYIDEETRALQEAMAAASEEYAILLANSDTYGDYTEELIIEVEADIDELNLQVEQSSSPMASQEYNLNSNHSLSNNSSAQNMINQSSADNNLSGVYVNDQSTKKEIIHTRIYEKIKSTIDLDEMSLSLEGQGSRIDQSTGLHLDTLGNNINGDSNTYVGSNGSAIATNITKTIGNIAPLIRINDAYFTGGEIIKFLLQTSEFIPTIMVVLQTANNDLIKANSIKDGDICSVFIQSDNDMLKSYRGDFKITNTIMDKKVFKQNLAGIHITIFGELFIPNLYNGASFYNHGTSFDAIEDAAKKLGLGFFICDDEPTNDIQMRWCVSNSKYQSTGTSPFIKYIKKTVLHAYKDENSFYDCWIDPRYGISFLNINKLLGEDGLDEQVDMAFFNNAMTNTIAANGDNIDEKSGKKYNKIMPKIFTNIAADTASASEFFVVSFKELNNEKISDNIGLYNKQVYNIKNTGISKDDNKVEFKSSLCINKTKLKHGFTILAGPGKNNIYEQADNGDYTELHTPVSGGQLSNTMSDIDGDNIINSGDNMKSSGNTHKFHLVAPSHNLLNNFLLKKKQIQLVLNGKNLLIMRGEKIPVLLMSNVSGSTISTDPTSNPNNTTINQMYELGSGWFIISAITWKYDVNRRIGGTTWTTEVNVTRREWPIPGWTELKDDTSLIEVQLNIDDKTTLENKTDEVASSTILNQENNVLNGSLPTSGLSQKMIDVWTLINNTLSKSGKSVKLVGARRWAADEEGNRVEGEPTILDGNVWKFVNVRGEVMWFSDKTSPHLYGNAIDIINGDNTDYNKMIKEFCIDPNIMAYMLINGIYGVSETARDDTGNTVKHFHIAVATSETAGDLKKFWDMVIKLNNNSPTFISNTKTYNMNQYLLYNGQTNSSNIS